MPRLGIGIQNYYSDLPRPSIISTQTSSQGYRWIICFIGTWPYFIVCLLYFWQKEYLCTNWDITVDMCGNKKCFRKLRHSRVMSVCPKILCNYRTVEYWCRIEKYLILVLVRLDKGRFQRISPQILCMVFSCMWVVSPSQEMTLCRWSKTDPYIKRSCPMITSYWDFWLMKFLICTLEIVHNLQKLGK